MRAAGPMAVDSMPSRFGGNGFAGECHAAGAPVFRSHKLGGLPPEALCHPATVGMAVYIRMRSGVAGRSPQFRPPAVPSRSRFLIAARLHKPDFNRDRRGLPQSQSITFHLHRRRHSPTACSARYYFSRCSCFRMSGGTSGLRLGWDSRRRAMSARSLSLLL